MLKKRIGCALLAAVAGASLSALPSKQSEAVSQRIVVEEVEGLPDDFMRGVDISATWRRTAESFTDTTENRRTSSRFSRSPA
ncbi:MAG: hypothetical protein IJ673_12090 [Treponema sp.]|nr:hypothetical protein [Treponema sp.]